MNKTIKLLDKNFPFKKSAYAHKDFEDRNKRAYNPLLASDILEYLYSCIIAGYFYQRSTPDIDIFQFYDLIDRMEMQDAQLLYKDNKQLFKELLGIATDILDEVKADDVVESDDAKKK